MQEQEELEDEEQEKTVIYVVLAIVGAIIFATLICCMCGYCKCCNKKKGMNDSQVSFVSSRSVNESSRPMNTPNRVNDSGKKKKRISARKTSDSSYSRKAESKDDSSAVTKEVVVVEDHGLPEPDVDLVVQDYNKS